MNTISIPEILDLFENKYNISLLKIQRKKIIFEGTTTKKKSIVVVMPESKIYLKGHGWVDFTKKQLDLFSKYSIVIAIFRLNNGSTYYIDFNKLLPLLTQDCMHNNKKEGDHWKLDIWPNELKIKRSNGKLSIKPNNSNIIDSIV